jgi:hypothetical protein
LLCNPADTDRVPGWEGGVMAVVAVLVFVAAYILIATERVPKSRALLLADLSGRGVLFRLEDP